MKSELPSMTVVTPSFNQAAYIRRTIESVLSQNVPGLEYLIFDAGSKDGTREILAEYHGRASIVIEPDKGQADAVNKGLGRARGDVIGWLNSDDVYYEGACRRVLEELSAHPETDVLYGEADHIDAQDRVIEPYYTESFDYDRLKEVCFICQPATFFRRRVVDELGLLRTDLRYCMDYEYWLRICASRPPRFVAQKLAGSRLHAETKTLGSREPVHREILTMLRERFGAPPTRWVYNLAHVIVEESGLTRETPQANAAFVQALVKTSKALFNEYGGGVPLRERAQMAGWAWAARRGTRATAG
jgi:glycosyltransferase involved in cell wall biosynthesis